MVPPASQIKHHQASYEAVATLSVEVFVGAEDISFFAIRTEYNGPLAASDCHIAGVTYD